MKVCQKLIYQLSKLYQDLIQENALFLINYNILYLDFIDAYRNSYNGHIEKCI